MTDAPQDGFLAYAARLHPFALAPEEALAAAANHVETRDFEAGAAIHDVGDPTPGLWLIESGAVALKGPDGQAVAHLGPGEIFGDREALRGTPASSAAIAEADARLHLLPTAQLKALIAAHPDFARAFARSAPAQSDAGGAPDALLSMRIRDLMTADPITIAPDAPVREAAMIIRDKDISCLPVCAGERLAGILTTGDLADRVIAEGLGADTPVSAVMTPDPMSVESAALGYDALVAMTERRISHLPVVDGGRLVGILTSTNLVKRQAVSAVFLVADIAKKTDYAGFAEVTARIPKLLAQLVGAGVTAYDVGRIVTSIADALTRRLLTLGEARLGPAPVPWLWAACGSQGRREQTGVSDQDNVLVLADSFDPEAHGAYFEALARFVSDGLDAAGYYYCPGDMMATADRWRQPVKVWRGYFDKWIRQPDEEAQMLASVMFDLRAIAGDPSLFEGLQEEVLRKAKANSIFRAHMVRNALKHQPPLSLFRGMATIRSGEHKDRIDMKLSGVVPIVDLGRLYALMGELPAANTRDRLLAARAAGIVSESGADDLIDAYDLIADMRLEHQARLIREGRKPDNFMPPAMLSDLERGHLKDAFAVVKTMQSAAANRFGM
jgi:CBS domain-containing protein